MIQDTTDLVAMAEALSRSADNRVLRRLMPRSPYTLTAGQEVRTSILLATETTGLDCAKGEIIELGMVKFYYAAEGRILGVRDTFSAFNEPSAPISAEVTALTGITNEMVAGRKSTMPPSWPSSRAPSSRSRITAASTENLPNATGPCSSRRPGAAA